MLDILKEYKRESPLPRVHLVGLAFVRSYHGIRYPTLITSMAASDSRRLSAGRLRFVPEPSKSTLLSLVASSS